MKRVKLWQFNTATLLTSLVFFGVEGTPAWAISAVIAWLINRPRSPGDKRYGIAFCVWAFFMIGLYQIRH